MRRYGQTACCESVVRPYSISYLHNVFTKKEMWHEIMPSVKYAQSIDERSENQKMMMIKVRHTSCQLFACANREHKQPPWKEFIARNINRVLKSETSHLSKMAAVGHSKNCWVFVIFTAKSLLILQVRLTEKN